MKPDGRPVTAAILAGGRARRWGGSTKSLERILGRRIVDWQLAVLRPLFSRVVIVCNDPQLGSSVGLPTVLDRKPGLGPLSGIDAALGQLPEHDEVVCVACDMPFLSPALVELVRDHQPGRDVVVPLIPRGPEPLLGRWHRHALGAVQMQLACDDHSVRAALLRLHAACIPEAEVRAADPELRSFANLNSAMDARREVMRQDNASSGRRPW